MSTELKREIKIRPGFDKRAEGYGVHGADIFFYVTGPKGAVQFMVSTGWLPPYNDKDREHRGCTVLPQLSSCLPMPYDLGYHSHKPQYDDHQPMMCDRLEGGECYYDGSSLNCIPVMEILVTKGSDGVWEFLEGYYRDLFENETEGT